MRYDDQPIPQATLSLAELKSYEARARELRAAAFRDMLAALFRRPTPVVRSLGAQPA